MSTKVYLALFVLLGGVTGAADVQAAAKEKESAIAELVEAHAKLKSYKATIKTMEDFEFPRGASVKSEVDGSVAWMRDDDKLLYRSDSKSSSVQKFQDQETTTEAEQTMIADGEYFYTIATMQGNVRVARQLINPMLAADAGQILEALRDEHEVRLVGEETVDEAPCYVFEVRPRNPDESPHMSRTVIHFRRDTGLAIRTVGYGEKGAMVYRSEHRDVEANPRLDRKPFKVELPEGVEVEDYTK